LARAVGLFPLQQPRALPANRTTDYERRSSVAIEAIAEGGAVLRRSRLPPGPGDVGLIPRHGAAALPR
jgi:hypothetical protein